MYKRQIYGYGKGANTNKVFNYVTGDSTDGIDTGVLTGSGARSINVDDINKITMYIPSDGEAYSHTVYYPCLLYTSQEFLMKQLLKAK